MSEQLRSSRLNIKNDASKIKSGKYFGIITFPAELFLHDMNDDRERPVDFTLHPGELEIKVHREESKN